MEFLTDITTQFVRDRIKETSWAGRSYIADLYNIERLIKQGGIKSVMQGYMFKALSSKYPVEWECIKKELTTGELTSPEEFVTVKGERARQAAAEEAARAERRAEGKGAAWTCGLGWAEGPSAQGFSPAYLR